MRLIRDRWHLGKEGARSCRRPSQLPPLRTADLTTQEKGAEARATKRAQRRLLGRLTPHGLSPPRGKLSAIGDTEATDKNAHSPLGKTSTELYANTLQTGKRKRPLSQTGGKPAADLSWPEGTQQTSLPTPTHTPRLATPARPLRVDVHQVPPTHSGLKGQPSRCPFLLKAAFPVPPPGRQHHPPSSWAAELRDSAANPHPLAQNESPSYYSLAA